MDNDEKIMLFFQLTDSSDPEEALQILEQNGWDLDASVNHYLLIHDQDTKQSSASSMGSGNGGSGSGSVDKEEDFIGYDDDENVRAPIPVTVETLVDGGTYIDPYYPASRVRSPAAPTTNVFEAFRDFTAEGKFGGANVNIPKQTPKQQHLAKLFEPPYDILSFGTFSQVKKLAADSKLMLLVNIQDISNFDCQVLNRDTWSDKGLKGYIKEHFIFWQIAHNNPEGVTYCSLYPVNGYPHISIIEPQTGMKKATHEGKMDSNETYKFLQQFISGPRGDVKKPKKYTSEEEELELAIQRSLGNDATSSRKQVDLEEEEDDSSDDEKDKEGEAEAEAEIEEEDDDLEKFESPPPVVVPPMTQPDTIGTVGDCTIQIRLPGGDMLKGQFAKDDKIQKLYFFVSVKKGISNFVLCTTFPKKELSGDVLNRTLSEEELAPRAILVLQEK